MLVNLTYELCLQGTVTALSQLAQLLLTLSIGLPLAGGTFVASDMEIGIREYLA